MVKPNDQFWDYAEKLDDGPFKGAFCGYIFAAGTSISRIKWHLSGVKWCGVRICEKVPKDVQESAYLVIHGTNKKLKTMPSASNNEENNTVSTSSREPNKEVENLVRDVGRMRMEVQSMENGAGVEGTFSCIEAVHVIENMTVEMTQPVHRGSSHEARGDSFQTTDVVAQALQKDWHGICTWLMEDDVLSCGRENMTEELMHPVERGTISQVLLAKAHEAGEGELPKKLMGQAFEENTNEILSWLMKDEVLNIGIYGMGGVGKTTLVTHIYNELLKRPDIFSHVYWITVSQDFSLYKLQNLIAKHIHLELSNEDDDMQRASKTL